MEVSVLWKPCVQASVPLQPLTEVRSLKYKHEAHKVWNSMLLSVMPNGFRDLATNFSVLISITWGFSLELALGIFTDSRNLLAAACRIVSGMWSGSLTRGWTPGPCIGNESLSHWPPGELPILYHFSLPIYQNQRWASTLLIIKHFIWSLPCIGHLRRTRQHFTKSF